MQYDLLIQIFDYQTNLFISGFMEYDMFAEIETEYLKRKELFTICLN